MLACRNQFFTGQRAGGDPYWSSVKLLQPFDSNMADVSSVARAITTVGSAVVDTGTKKWGAGSLSVPTVSDYLTAANSTDFQFLTGGFTIEAWIKTTQSTDYGSIAMYSTSNDGWNFLTSANGSKMFCSVGDGGATAALTGATTINDGNWHHVAMSHDGTTFRILVDGVVDASVANTMSVTNSAGLLYIGRWATAIRPFVGHIDDLRITKGVARYTGSYTVPTAAFPTS